MDKNLHTIQVLGKVGRIVARVIWIVCTVATMLMIGGIIALACGLDGMVKVGDITIHGLIKAETELSTKQAYIALTVGAIMAAGNAIMAWFADRYFTMQVKTGTPFTVACADGMRKLGLIYVIGALILSAVATTVAWIMESTLHTSVLMNLESSSGFIAGIMFLVFSVFFRYGAEKFTPTDQDSPTTDQTQPQK